MEAQKTITFITGHYYNSSRRAGFHNLADAAHRAGFRVNFVTAGYSLFSYLRGDYRTKIRGISKNYNKPLEIRPGFVSYVHFTPWHPMTLLVPALNKLSAKFMDKYGGMDLGKLLPLIKATDVFVFESMSGLFLFRRFCDENPGAKKIFRVSDDIRILRSTHPRLVELETAIAPDFDCISVPSAFFVKKYQGLSNLHLHLHGLNKEAFDQATNNPYIPSQKNVVFTGAAFFDTDFLSAAAKGLPEVNYHVVGPVPKSVELPNIKYYGELPFKETIPYVKFADVGLLSLKYRNESSACFTDSLKTLQYRYCGLPIVSPDFIDLNREGVYYYHPGNPESAVAAVRAALAVGRNPDYAKEVRSWDEVLQDILAAAGVSQNN